MLQHKGGWTHIPCTPQGILWLLGECIGMDKLRGKHALIINRSDLVGRPLSQLLLNYDMTVTVCHSKTPKQTILREFSTADVVISAAGVQNLITEDEIYSFNSNPHRIIIDVSINRDENGKLCGDFSEEFKQKYSEHYTPVPGGVGPMTVAALMHNTYEAAVWREKYIYMERRYSNEFI
jgi:methylenetetrahydrofolate dehydrogenase (NADP+)/methenyltetrahydrofolate cyclohydrolase